MKMYEVSFLEVFIGFNTCIIFAESKQAAESKCAKRAECQGVFSVVEILVK